MGTNHIFVDFENVQPKNFGFLLEHDVRVMVFVGATQTTISTEVAKAVQSLGDRATYCSISQTRANALDFHITYYLGRACALKDGDYFHIISKDKGYDPLIEHLRADNLKVRRWTSISELPFIAANQKDLIKERIELVTTNLKSRKANLPKKTQTLANSIKSMFGNSLDIAECEDLVIALEKQGRIAVDAGAVTYCNL